MHLRASRRRTRRRRRHRRLKAAAPAAEPRAKNGAMGALRTILCAAALTACANNPSPLDKTVGHQKVDPTQSSDPWSTLTSSGDAKPDGDGGALGGFDIKGILQKVAAA